MTNMSRAINHVFTRSVVSDLLRTGSSDVFDCVVKHYSTDPESKTYGEIISEIYVHLGKEKRNEYYYQNTLLNKLLVGIHSVNTTTALSQLRIDNSIADFVMINGEGRVYEIKSDLDTFDRLEGQLYAYFKAFSKVSVLVAEQELNQVKQRLSTFGDVGAAVGVYVLTTNDRIFSPGLSQEPRQFDNLLDHACIFKLLRKREYENVLKRHFGEIPQTKPVFHFRLCLEKFCEIPLLEAQKLAFNELKKRNHITKTNFEKIQKELRSVVYFSGLSHQLPNLERLLQMNYRG